MTHKIISMYTYFLFLGRVMKNFFFLDSCIFFSESGFLILFYREKGQTNGGLIGETSKKPIE